jgi:hypothetical protein
MLHHPVPSFDAARPGQLVHLDHGHVLGYHHLYDALVYQLQHFLRCPLPPGHLRVRHLCWLWPYRKLTPATCPLLPDQS